MCCKISFVCFVMRKSKIISHIMHDLTESSPVYSGILFLRVLLDKLPSSYSGGDRMFRKNSCLVVRNDGFRSGMILPRAKRFSVLLETVHLRHLVSQVSCLTVYVIFYAIFSLFLLSWSRSWPVNSNLVPPRSLLENPINHPFTGTNFTIALFFQIIK